MTLKDLLEDSAYLTNKRADLLLEINEHNGALEQFNPFKIGETLTGNSWTHSEKEFVVDKIGVSNGNGRCGCKVVGPTDHFYATGYVLKADGKPSGVYRTTRYIKIEDVSHD